MRSLALVVGWAGLAVALAACVSSDPALRDARARYAYHRIARELTMPASKETNELARALLWRRAERAYLDLQRMYPDAQPWAAMAQRSLANLYREQGDVEKAIEAYARVGDLYPHQDWEVAQAWKAAGDLLWERGRKVEASAYYRDLLARFDKPGQHPMFESLVLIARMRLLESAP